MYKASILESVCERNGRDKVDDFRSQLGLWEEKVYYDFVVNIPGGRVI